MQWNIVEYVCEAPRRLVKAVPELEKSKDTLKIIQKGFFHTQDNLSQFKWSQKIFRAYEIIWDRLRQIERTRKNSYFAAEDSEWTE